MYTKQPVGSQHLLGLGNTFAQAFFTIEVSKLLLPKPLPFISMISIQLVINGS